MGMGLKIFQVDAFTDKPFAGNPAGVCVLQAPRDDSWMQNVAREMNLSETAFLQRQDDGFDLRWFTPSVEVDLCGHATLASAHILWEMNFLRHDEEARFHTRSGLLSAHRKDHWIELDFPALPAKKTAIPPKLSKALGVKPKYVGKNRRDYLIEVDSERTVRKMKPDFTLLEGIPIGGVMVTAKATAEPYDFVSRFFAPRFGINEDPVTGSAHCCLGPYWQKRLNKDEFLAYQASSRGGVLRVRVGKNRVYLGGQATTILDAELRE
jgi:PhzF family phenazine biosynthesis protein